MYDSVYPANRDTAVVSIRVVRNPSGPVFDLPQYLATIPDTYELGRSILKVTARDQDGVRKQNFFSCIQLKACA